MITLRRAIVPSLVAAAAFAFAACSDNNADTSSTAQQSDVDTITARVQRNEMMFALVELRAPVLHEMSETIAAGTIETTFVPITREALRLLTLTDWGTLQPAADKVAEQATALLAALQDDDVEAAKEPAEKLHAGYHDFNGTVWEQLEQGTPRENAVEEEDGESTTPEAGATSEAGPTEER